MRQNIAIAASNLDIFSSLGGRTTAFVFCVFAFLGQGTAPLLADGALVPQLVSYSSADPMSSPTSSVATTKKIRVGCYPAKSLCTKNSDCCSGQCRDWHGHASYCYPKGW